MVHNLVEILKKDDKQCNHLKLWLFISTSQLLIQSISEYVKLARLAMCQVLGFVKVEHCFNTLFFMKGKLCNYLTSHLDLCVKMFSQDLYSIEFSLYSNHSYQEGKEDSLQCSFLKLERLMAFYGFWILLLAFILGFGFWNLSCEKCPHGNMHLLISNGPLGKDLQFDTSSI